MKCVCVPAYLHRVYLQRDEGTEGVGQPFLEFIQGQDVALAPVEVPFIMSMSCQKATRKYDGVNKQVNRAS